MKKQNINHSIDNFYELLGCSFEEYEKYLEEKQGSKINWDNYGRKKGQFSIDHIIPLSSLDLSKKEAREFGFNFKNTQILDHRENIKKGTYVSFPIHGELLNSRYKNFISEKQVKTDDEILDEIITEMGQN
jgi:hypothetical protein